jgi:tRNA uridine 5-carbamoylmethylation protein Kti12
MNLVYIYGPPAVGKLTVANELAKLTGYKVFHNHVSIVFVKSIFEFGTPTFWRFVDKYRKEMLEGAAKERINTIFTFVYGKGTDDKFVRDILRRVKSHSARVCFVRLYCKPEELARRLGRKSIKILG